MMSKLLPDKYYTEKREITSISAGESLEIKSLSGTRVTTIESINKILTLAAIINPSITNDIHEFLPILTQWESFSFKEKCQKYSSHICNEFNLFLYFRDKEFFNKVISPFLKSKLIKCFMDQWLLNEDLIDYTKDIHKFNQLNDFEILLLYYHHSLRDPSNPIITEKLRHLIKNKIERMEKKNKSVSKVNEMKKIFDTIIENGEELNGEMKKEEDKDEDEDKDKDEDEEEVEEVELVEEEEEDNVDDIEVEEEEYNDDDDIEAEEEEYNDDDDIEAEEEEYNDDDDIEAEEEEDDDDELAIRGMRRRTVKHEKEKEKEKEKYNVYFPISPSYPSVSDDNTELDDYLSSKPKQKGRFTISSNLKKLKLIRKQIQKKGSPFYEEIETTTIWSETGNWNSSIIDTPVPIEMNPFWKDLFENLDNSNTKDHDQGHKKGENKILSKNIISILNKSFTELFFACAVIDLPLTTGKNDQEITLNSQAFKIYSKSNIIILYKQLMVRRG